CLSAPNHRQSFRPSVRPHRHKRLKNTVRQDAAQMFQVNAATIDSRVKGFGHFLNILRTDDTPVTGVTLNADTKEF
ncbi:hypothetical protein SJH87_13105, partial [Staphylococcus sp. GCP4]|nr:hypothetical protein [Staphylococcus sp. GCP4]